MKKLLYVFLLCGLMFCLTGCEEEKNGLQMTIFYLNSDENTLVQDEYVLVAEKTTDRIEEVLQAIQNAEHNVNYHAPIPETVEIKEYRYRNRQLDLVFKEGYNSIPKGREVLLRAAVVQTMVQIPDVNVVSFYVEEQPLTTLSGTVVGYMRAEDFVQNTGSILKSYQTTDLKLYFSNVEGTALTMQKRTDIKYGSNTSIEKLVVEQLMKGTSSDKCRSTIPSNAKLLSVSVKDGVCYVNFDSSFLSEGYNQVPEVTIYSIVNSIIANGNATKVQILVDGSSDVKFMGTFDLNQSFEWKADIIEE